MARILHVLPLLAAGWAGAQTVSVSGTVQSARTGSPIAGASVALDKLSIAGTTDSAGRFTLLGSTSAISPALRRRPESAGALAFHQEIDGPLAIRIVEPDGRVLRTLQDGILAAGWWSVAPPPLPAGLHLCVFEGAQGTWSQPFLGSLEAAPRAGALQPVFRALAASVDTLRVRKAGYRTALVPLTRDQQAGLVVALDDSLDATLDSATFVPDTSWPCYMPDGIPPPARGDVAFTVVFQIGAIHDVGVTQFGHRIQYDLKGGSVKGTRIDATVQSGSLDYELTLSNGGVEDEQIAILMVGTTPILMRNAGIAPSGAGAVRMVLDFEAPNSSSYTWLNTGKYAALRVVDTVAKTITLQVREISNATLPSTRVAFPVPSAVHPTWNCRTLSGSQGTTVFTESVSLASSVSIGASKRGSRNIIPITGGTTSGKVVGKILSGGADYQLGGLDARYTIQTDDGEFIVIRNCGPSQLVPLFEARAAGPYSFLDEMKYLSSSPSVSGSGVSITFYEKK